MTTPPTPADLLAQALKELKTEQQQTARLLTRLERQQQELHFLKISVDKESHSRLLAEEELDETQDRLSLAVDAAQLALWEWNLTSGKIYLSKRWGEMIGEQPKETSWTQNELLQRVHPDDLEHLHTALNAALKGQTERYAVEHRFRTASGWLWIESQGMVTARDMLGEATKMIGTNADISSRRAAQAEMQRARDLAEAGSRAKSEFLANISHEVRTPLNGIMGLTQLMMGTTLSPEQDQYLRLVDSSAKALLALLNDVLDFSKIEAGKMVFEQIPFALEAFVEETVAIHAVAAREKGLELRVHLDNGLPSALVGDPGRLRQVVSNLLSNAIKFTQRGEIELAVSAKPTLAGRIRLRIKVADTGIGIAPDKQTLIFEAFSQADSSITRQYGGSGLGLVICERLVRMMGGQIKVKSLPGKGSVFGFEVNLGLASEATQPAALQAADSPIASAFSGLRVLLAEDQAVNELLMRKMLALMGCQVAVARNGREAVALWERGEVELIFMDVQMPEMSGPEATQSIRQKEVAAGMARTPIVALTAHAMLGDRERFLAAGMDAYVSKPVSIPALVDAMQAVLQRPQTLKATSPSPKPMPPAQSRALDAGKLLQRLGGDQEALQEIAVAMREDLAQRSAKLIKALATQDTAMACSEAHALKGALASLTADRAALLAKRLEINAAQSSWEQFAQTLPLFINEGQRLDGELAALCRADDVIPQGVSR